MKYQYNKQIYTSKRELLHVLIEYAYLKKRPEYKSRTLYVEDLTNFVTIEFTFFFDGNDICGFKEKKQEPAIVQTDKEIYKKYRLYSYEFMDTEGEPYETREQVINELKIHEGHKYTLKIDGVQNRIHVHYENGILFCDNKPYKI